MNADEAIRLIRDGDCICVNSFVGIENPTRHYTEDIRKCSRRRI
jgi:propionate CoA-transferase